MDYRLRSDSRVRLLERTNARYLAAEQVEAVGFVAMDVSFISASLVLPAVVAAGFGTGQSSDGLVVLVKPQFEAGREHVGKGGIVRNPEAQMLAVEKIRHSLHELGFGHTDWTESPILGAEGNREFLVYARRPDGR
jgi:23S rRNA (cytidine1920-2'-O)/16S rRNA (cytidine1409-2'-O)-methyltransferase